MIVFSTITKSLKTTLYEFFDSFSKVELTVSKQAFSKARQKLDSNCFIELQDDLVSDFYTLSHQRRQLSTHLDRLIVAVDGSYIQLPPKPELRTEFGESYSKNGHNIVNGLMIAAIDVSNGMIIGADLCSSKVGERELFERLYPQYKKRLKGSPPICWVFDRGYPSFDLFFFLIEEKQEFIMRYSHKYSAELNEFKKSMAVDAIIVIDLNKSSRRRSYKKLRAKIGGQELKVRLVKIIQKGKEDQYLVTNTKLNLEELAEIYQMRWGVEEFNDYLKNTVHIERISSLKVQGVLQDFNSQILGAMIHKLLVYEAKLELEKQEKIGFQINLSTTKLITNRLIVKILISGKGIVAKLRRLRNIIAKEKLKTQKKPPQQRIIKRKGQKEHLNNRPCI